jgi:cytochrome c
MKLVTVVSTAVLALSLSCSAYASVDEAAARALYKSPKNNCVKCHSVDKEKDGPAYRKVAEKYKGKADAEKRLIEHITSGEKAKFPDGHEEEHKIISEKDPEQLKNLVQWILAQ